MTVLRNSKTSMLTYLFGKLVPRSRALLLSLIASLAFFVSLPAFSDPTASRIAISNAGCDGELDAKAARECIKRQQKVLRDVVSFREQKKSKDRERLSKKRSKKERVSEDAIRLNPSESAVSASLYAMQEELNARENRAKKPRRKDKGR